MPADLDYPTGVEVWRTTSSVPTNGPFGDAARREVNLIARLRSGVTIEQATSEIVALSERLEADAPSERDARSCSRRSSFRGRGRRRRPNADARPVRCRGAGAADRQRERGEPPVDAWRSTARRACAASRPRRWSQQNPQSGADREPGRRRAGRCCWSCDHLVEPAGARHVWCRTGCRASNRSVSTRRSSRSRCGVVFW